jgi:hypothetical protein
MPASKAGLSALFLALGLCGAAQAQQKPESPKATGAYPASQSPGNLSDYYGMTPNFANYGLSGTYPAYGGYGYGAYGPGAQFGAHYETSKTAKPAANKPAARPEAGRKPTVPASASSKGAPRLRKGL